MLDHSIDQTENELGALNAEHDLAKRVYLDQPPIVHLADAVRLAADETGSGTSWLPRFWQCVNAPGKLSSSEFFYYGLYRQDSDGNDLSRYVGKRVQSKLHRACCDPTWFAIARDKLLFVDAMRGAGIPVPETLSIFDPKMTRVHPRSITSRRGMTAFLDQQDVYPIFMKPIDGMYSVGVVGLTDGGNGRAHMKGQGVVSTRDIANYMRDMSEEGYLLQRMLMPAKSIASQFGGALATVRFLVLIGKDGPEIESALIKIPSVTSVADNYWRGGNMIGAVDIATGAIRRVVTGMAASLREAQIHPDTGQPLLGFQLPDWQTAVSMCHRAAGTLPGLRTQSWDIALTNKGPVAIEVNWGGDLNLHQLAHGRGALSENYCSHLRANGYKGKLPD